MKETRNKKLTLPEKIKLIEDDRFFVKKIDDKIGYGVFAKQKFMRKDFLLQYKGENISPKEAERRALDYKHRGIGNFIFDQIKDCRDKWICIDGTMESSFGRLVNDSPQDFANSVMKREKIGNRVILCLYALNDIEIGTELRYDYNFGSSQVDTNSMPWRLNYELYAEPKMENTPSLTKETETNTATETNIPSVQPTTLQADQENAITKVHFDVVYRLSNNTIKIEDDNQDEENDIVPPTPLKKNEVYKESIIQSSLSESSAQLTLTNSSPPRILTKDVMRNQIVSCEDIVKAAIKQPDYKFNMSPITIEDYFQNASTSMTMKKYFRNPSTFPKASSYLISNGLALVRKKRFTKEDLKTDEENYEEINFYMTDDDCRSEERKFPIDIGSSKNGLFDQNDFCIGIDKELDEEDELELIHAERSEESSSESEHDTSQPQSPSHDMQLSTECRRNQVISTHKIIQEGEWEMIIPNEMSEYTESSSESEYVSSPSHDVQLSTENDVQLSTENELVPNPDVQLSTEMTFSYLQKMTFSYLQKMNSCQILTFSYLQKMNSCQILAEVRRNVRNANTHSLTSQNI
ncbi:uncharacterized protein [Clytia hemisphaerica]|uniref:uncharacterized protein isoform X2 n=1 Tax=Clytia hemisphaerica TaxID=252671 RepID=UPI0034D46195